MLELTDGGRMIAGEDAIEFFEGLADVIPEEAKTEEFCDEFTWALNRFRYEARKSIPKPVKVYKGNRFTEYSCGQCGNVAFPGDVFCRKCGRKIRWP